MKDTLFLFRDEKDANQFYLFVLSSNIDGQVIINGNEVKLSFEEKKTQARLIELIYPFIIDLFVPRISKQILREKFYYHDDEIDQIVPFILSICSVSKMLHSNLTFSLYEQLVYYWYENQTVINMEDLYKQLFEEEESWLEIVGYGIEEWQFELSFQEKMNEIRHYVFHKKSKIPNIIIYLSDHIAFFDANGQVIREETLNKYQTKNVPRFDEYNHSFLVSTLLSIAPDRIEVYASNEHMHTLYWLLNIFQEKMTLYSEEQFPFKLVK